MAWSFVEAIDKTQNELSGRWYVRFSITDGKETRVESLKFQTNPTNPEAQAAVVAFIQALNERARIEAKESDPPDIGELLTAGQKTTLRNSVLILEALAEVYDAEVRDTFKRFVELYRAGLIKFLKS